METTSDSSSIKDAGGEGVLLADGSVHPGWKTTFASTVGMMLGPSPILLFSFGTFVAPLNKEFGWSVASISIGAMLITLMLVVCSVIQGWAVDRFGPRRLILTSIPCFGLAVAAMYWMTSSIVLFYVALVLASFCAVGVWPIAYNKAIAGWFDRRLGLSLGLGNAGVGFGAALLPALSSYIIAQHGWRSAYLVLGILAVVVVWPVVFALLKKAPTDLGGAKARPGASQAESGLTFSEARKTRSFVLVLVGFLLLGLISSSMVIHQIAIQADLGMTLAQATAMQSALGLALIVGRIGTGWLLDRVHASVVLVGMCVAASIALLLLYAGAPFGTAPLCAILLGLVIGAEFDALGYLIPRYFGQKSFGRLYAAIFASFQLFSAAAIPVVGMVKSSTGSYGPALGVLAGVMIVAAFAFSRIGPYRYPTR